MRLLYAMDQLYAGYIVLIKLNHTVDASEKGCLKEGSQRVNMCGITVVALSRREKPTPVWS
jgi:hypothetical protein